MRRTFGWYHKFAAVLVVAAALSVVSSSQAHAYMNWGYFSGVDTCTTDSSWNYHCPDAFASVSQNNVIGGNPAIPDWAYAGTTQNEIKTNFFNWLMSAYFDGSDPRNQLGARVIVATMLGWGNKIEDVNALQARLNDPAIAVGLVYDDPNNYGAISFSGRRVDGAERDVFFTYDYDSPPKSMLVFYHNGNPVYVVEVPCANPVGVLPGLPPVVPPNVWSLSGNTTVSTPTAQPGQQVTFTHYVTNNGPNQADGVWYDTLVSAGTPGTPKSGTGPYSIAPGTSLNGGTDVITIPINAPAGTVYCEVVGYAPSNSSGGGYANGPWGCVTVTYNYQLTPAVATASTVVPFGGSADFSFSVTKTGSLTYPTDVRIRQVIIPPNTTLPIGMGVHDDITCADYGVSCSDIETISGNYVFSNPVTSFGTRTVSVGGNPAGTRVCRVLVVVSRDQNPGLSRDSAVTCVVVSRAPIMSVVGGDSWAGGKIAASGCTDTNPYGFKGAATSALGFGSYGEYGLLSTKQITDFGSAGLLSATNLTFANTPTLGSFTSDHCITDFASKINTKYSPLTTGTLIPSGPVFTLPNNPASVYYATNDITIGTTTGIDDQVIIYAAGHTVTITGDLTYQVGGYGSFNDTPSLTIIADKIAIAPNVAQVDGVLFAATALTTCSAAGYSGGIVIAALVSGAACQQAAPLVINGAVITGELTPARTLGGATSTDKPAEIFRFRPEVFLTPYATGVDSNAVLVTKLEYEMPPRY